MYSPILGRFMQRDPAGYVDGVNLYAYVKNRPLVYLDPWGLTAQVEREPLAGGTEVIDWNEIAGVEYYLTENIDFVDSPTLPWNEAQAYQEPTGQTEVGVINNAQNNPILVIDPSGLFDTGSGTGFMSWYGLNGYDMPHRSLTRGQKTALLKTAAGAGGVIVGAVTLPEGAPLLAASIPVLAHGATQAFVEFMLQGDTSDIPNDWSIMGQIGEGVVQGWPDRSDDSGRKPF